LNRTNDFPKYPKIKWIGDEQNRFIFSDPEKFLVVQEKIDGANFRFNVSADGIIFGSRNKVLSDSETNKIWQPYMDYIRKKVEWVFKKPEVLDYISELVFYGEATIPHSIIYDPTIPPVIIFDAFSKKRGMFINLAEIEGVTKLLKLDMVPSWMWKVEKLQFLTDKDIPQSNYYPGKAEGIVVKDYNQQVFAKFKTKNFIEVNRKKFGASPKVARDDNERLINKYVTNKRIEGMIFKLRDEGMPIGMAMMKKLPQAVWQDVIDECANEIFRSNLSVNFRTCRKLLATRCREVLQMKLQQQLVAGGLVNEN